MTPAEIRILIPAFSGFHQDFDLDDVSEREVLAMHARGLEASMREPLYLALECLLSESNSDRQFSEACGKAGAHFTPERGELERFVAWARTAEGAAEIAGPGPTSSYVVVQINLGSS